MRHTRTVTEVHEHLILGRLPPLLLLLLLLLMLLLLLLLQLLLLLLLRLLLLVPMQLLAFVPMLADTRENCCCAGAPRHCAWGADKRSRIVVTVRINILPIIILCDILVLVVLLLLAGGHQPGRRPPERCYEHRYSRRSLVVRLARARLSIRVHRRGLRWAPGQRPRRRLHQRLLARGRAQPGISQQRHHDCPQHRRSHSIPSQLVAQHIGEGLQQIESPGCNSLQGQQVRRVQKSAQSETKDFPPDH